MCIDVKIKIESTIESLDDAGLPEGDSERTVSTALGSYSFKEGNARLCYIEEGEGGRAESEIILHNGAVTVKRKGAIESELYFKEGESHSSVYSIPPYKFDAVVMAKRVSAELDGHGGTISLVYNMKIGGAEKSARMKIWISQASNQA